MIFADRERSRDCWSNKGLSLGRCKELVSPGCYRKILLGSASEDLSARQFIEAEGQKVGKKKIPGATQYSPEQGNHSQENLT